MITLQKNFQHLHPICKQQIGELDLSQILRELCNEGVEQAASLRAQLDEVQAKLETIEEKYFVMGEMSRETYEKFSLRYKGGQATIVKELDKLSPREFEPI